MASSNERDSDNPSTTGAPVTDAPENVASPAAAGASESDPLAAGGAEGDSLLMHGGLGSGLLAQQPTPAADETVAVAKVCPQCGGEYETGDRFCPKDGSPLRPKAGGDPLVGRVIADRYLVLALLGEGGMGRVYLAEHVKMNRQCAIKVMNPTLVNDTESSQRFAREASNAARILHSNVAAVFDYGEADRIVYLVMEYVDGESLSTILEGGSLDPRRAIDLARQIADGLAAAHELGIVHRDLKPDNVIVARSRSGREIPKVVDFGIAKAISEAPQDALTRSGLVIGTPEYMSPEQLLGDPIDARSDIYSLGCILYQMLTGKSAFAAESREQMIRRRLHEAPPHVRDLMPGLPRRLDTLIVHMLARAPGDRLATAAEARDALDPALALGGWDPKMITVQRPTPKMSMQAARGLRLPTDPSLRPTMPLPRQRTSIAGMVTRTLLGAALIVAGVVYWGMRHSAATARQAAAADTSAAGLLPKMVPDSVIAPKRQSAAPTATTKPTPSTTGRGTAKRDTTHMAAAKVDTANHDTTAKDTVAQTKPAIDSAYSAPILALANIIELGDSSKSLPQFKKLPDKQQKYFESIYGQMEAGSLKVTPTNLSVAHIVNDRREVGFVLKGKFRSQSKDQYQLPSFYDSAILEKQGGGWVITKITDVSRP